MSFDILLKRTIDNYKDKSSVLAEWLEKECRMVLPYSLSQVIL